MPIPNHSTAASSAARNSGRPTIGLLTENLNMKTMFQDVWRGMQIVARARDVNLIAFTTTEMIFTEAFHAANPGRITLDFITAERIDGLVTMEWWETQAWFEQVCRRYHPLPVVTVMRQYPGTPGVTPDNYQGARLAMAHLIDVHGYRRIAYVHGTEGSPTNQTRFRAYQDALAAAGLPLDPALITAYVHPEGHEHGARAVRLLLDERHLTPGGGLEAMLTFNDWTAHEILQVLQRRGIRVPEDIAVMGFDNERVSAFSAPPLSTVAVSYVDLGKQAAETVLAMIAGEVISEVAPTPLRLCLRQSCGCVDTAFTRTIPARPSDPEWSFATAVAAQRSQILADLYSLSDPSVTSLTDWPERLLDNWLKAVQMPASEVNLAQPVLSVLENDVMTMDQASQMGDVRQDALSVLYRHLWPCLRHETVLRDRADQIWQQARIGLHQYAQLHQMRRQAEVDRQGQILRDIGQKLISTFALERLIEILAAELPRLQIPGVYLMLYADPAQPTATGRLILAYDAHGRMSLPADGRAFPAQHLAPEAAWQTDGRLERIVLPLYFGNEQLGLMVFETGTYDEDLCGILRGQISSALQGALLVQRVQERSAEIVRQKYILDTFMANVPDSIYFKDCDSRIIQANQALATRLGLDDPADVMGKTDFDLFPEEQARPKYEVEQEIIKTGQPLLDLEEPDAGGGWSLTTKMPLRDEHGDIIGTFGISRDITDLKQAQHELAAAYEEIRIMNVQLKEENIRMSAELDVARRLQEMILPLPEELQQINGLDIVGYMKPADEVGGDYYDVLKKNGTIHIGIGDVTGHGLESGVLMLMTQTTIRALIEHGETDPVAFVNTLNRTIYKNVRRMGADKTLTFALINYQEGQLKIVGQHEELLIVRKGGQVERVDTIDLGFPIGLEEEISQWIESATVRLEPGDGIVLYTDGITEAANLNNELYGLERLCEVVSRNWNASAEEIKQAVVADVTRHIGEQKVYDDLTLVVLKQL